MKRIRLITLLFGLFSFSLTGCDFSDIANLGKSVETNEKDGGASIVHQHTFKSEWSYDERFHWHDATCEHTSEKDSYAAHDMKYLNKAATFEDEGYLMEYCQTCDYEKIVATYNKLTHHFSDMWSYNDEGHFHYCTDSGYTTLTSEVIPHNLEVYHTHQPTFTSQGYTTYKCSDCDYQVDKDFVEPKQHTFGDYFYDETNHWQKCSDPGFETLFSDHVPHDFKAGTPVDPTFEADGYTLYTCVCGYSYKGDIVAKKEHNYSPDWSSNSSTHWHACLDEGYTNLKGERAAHTYIWDHQAEPTDDESGLYVGTCSTCGYVSNWVVPATKDLFSYIHTTGGYVALFKDSENQRQLEVLNENQIPTTYLGEDVVELRIKSEYIKTVNIPQGINRVDFDESCKNLEVININDSNETYSSIDGVLFSKDQKTLMFFPYNKNAGKNYTVPNATREIAINAFYYPHLGSITLNDGLEKIYQRAFVLAKGENNHIKELEIPETVKWIGDTIVYPAYYFSYDKNNQLVDLRNSSNPVDPQEAEQLRFKIKYHCSNDIEYFGMDNLVNLLYDCGGVSEYKGFNYIGNTSNPYACLVSTNNHEVSEFNVHPGCSTFACYAVSDLHSLEEILIPSHVKNINTFAIDSVYGIKELVIPETVERINVPFARKCEDVETIRYNSNGETYWWESYFMTDRGYAQLMSGLVDFIVGDNVLEIPAEAFAFIKGFEEQIGFNVYLGSGVTKISQYLFNDTVINTVVIPEQIEVVDDAAFYQSTIRNLVWKAKNVFYNDLCLEGTHSLCKDATFGTITLDETAESFEGNGWFTGAVHIDKFILKSKNFNLKGWSSCPTSELIIEEGVERVPEIFDGCLVSEVIFPESVVYCGSFLDCPNLIYVEFKGDIRYLNSFSGPNFSYVLFDKHVKEPFYYQTSAAYFFKDSEDEILEHMSEPHVPEETRIAKYYDVESKDKVFYQNGFTFYDSSEGLILANYTGHDDNVTIPSSIEHNNRTIDVHAIGKYAFFKSTVSEITIPNGIKEIRECAFLNCENLKTVNFNADNVNSSYSMTTNFNMFPFANCYSLTTFNIGDSVEIMAAHLIGVNNNIQYLTLGNNLRVISNNAFDNVENISRIILPSSLESIGSNAFLNSYALCEIVNYSNLEITAGLHESEFGGIAQFVYNVYKNENEIVNEIINDDGTIYYKVGEELYLKYISLFNKNKFTLREGITRYDIVVGGENHLSSSNATNGEISVFIPLNTALPTRVLFANYKRIRVYFYGGVEDDTVNLYSKFGSLSGKDTIVRYYSEEEPTDTDHLYFRLVDNQIVNW